MPSEERADTRRTLSSGQTFFVKFFGPALIVPLGAYLVYLTARSSVELDTMRGGIAIWTVPWLAVIGGFLFNLWWGFALKRVAIDGDSILISNYSREVRLPLSAIIDVRENRWIKLHPVTIVFDRETPWGSNIKFMPRLRWFAFSWMSHPVVTELRDRAAAARAGIGVEAGDGGSYLPPRALAFGDAAEAQ
jgi:hypothetical protein